MPYHYDQDRKNLTFLPNIFQSDFEMFFQE